MTRAVTVGGLWALAWACAIATSHGSLEIIPACYGAIAPLCLLGAVLGDRLPTRWLRDAPMALTVTMTGGLVATWGVSFVTHHFLLTHSFDLLEEVAALFAGVVLAGTLAVCAFVGWCLRRLNQPSRRWAALPLALLAILAAGTASWVTPSILGFEALGAMTVVATAGCAAWGVNVLGPSSQTARWETVTACGLVLAAAIGLGLYAGSSETREGVWRHDPMTRSLMRGVIGLSDGDGDGVASALGHPDCHPDDDRRFPGARERPGDGIDDNCLGGDASGEDVLALWSKGGSRHPTTAPLPFERARHHILLITIDTVRADALSLYGAPRPTSPNLNNLGQLALVFEQAWSPSNYTATSLFSLMTGLYPSAFLDGESVASRPGLTLAERLGAAGWGTEAIVDLHPALPHVYAGFQTIDQSLGTRAAGAVRNRSTGSTANEITGLAITALDRLSRRQNPGMLWLHYSEPHAAYLEHEGYDLGEDTRGRYEGEIAFTDAAIGRLLAHANETGRLKDTIIIITSDHGEAFGEHGVWTHGQSLYEEELHVPLIIYLPNDRGDGFRARRVNSPVDLTDVMPTVLDAVGMAPAHPVHGESLLPHGLNDAPLRTPAVFAEVRLPYARLQAWRKGDDKWIFNHLTGHVARYDLSSDPDETQPLPPDPSALDRVTNWLDLHLSMPTISTP